MLPLMEPDAYQAYLVAKHGLRIVEKTDPAPLLGPELPEPEPDGSFHRLGQPGRRGGCSHALRWPATEHGFIRPVCHCGQDGSQLLQARVRCSATD